MSSYITFTVFYISLCLAFAIVVFAESENEVLLMNSTTNNTIKIPSNNTHRTKNDSTLTTRLRTRRPVHSPQNLSNDSIPKISPNTTHPGNDSVIIPLGENSSNITTPANFTSKPHPQNDTNNTTPVNLCLPTNDTSNSSLPDVCFHEATSNCSMQEDQPQNSSYFPNRKMHSKKKKLPHRLCNGSDNDEKNRTDPYPGIPVPTPSNSSEPCCFPDTGTSKEHSTSSVVPSAADKMSELSLEESSGTPESGKDMKSPNKFRKGDNKRFRASPKGDHSDLAPSSSNPSSPGFMGNDNNIPENPSTQSSSNTGVDPQEGTAAMPTSR